MALSESSLKNRIVAELQASGFKIDSGIKDKTSWCSLFLDAIAKAVVDEIKQNALTTPADGHTHGVE